MLKYCCSRNTRVNSVTSCKSKCPSLWFLPKILTRLPFTEILRKIRLEKQNGTWLFKSFQREQWNISNVVLFFRTGFSGLDVPNGNSNGGGNRKQPLIKLRPLKSMEHVVRNFLGIIDNEVFCYLWYFPPTFRKRGDIDFIRTKLVVHC